MPLAAPLMGTDLKHSSQGQSGGSSNSTLYWWQTLARSNKTELLWWRKHTHTQTHPAFQCLFWIMPGENLLQWLWTGVQLTLMDPERDHKVGGKKIQITLIRPPEWSFSSQSCKDSRDCWSTGPSRGMYRSAFCSPWKARTSFLNCPNLSNSVAYLCGHQVRE